MPHISAPHSDNAISSSPLSNLKPRPYSLDKLNNSQQITTITYPMPYLSGKMEDATALLFYPRIKKPQNGWKIIVWMHGTVGVALACAPSRNPLNADFKGMAERLLAEGYLIVAPDYEGLGTSGIHPYLHLKSAANAAIYAVKALKESAPDDFQGDWMVIGQSQGGQAALGTAEYANDDPAFKGAVAAAPASNLQMIIQEIAPNAFDQLAATEAQHNIALNNRVSIHSFATLLSYAAFVGAGIKAQDPHFNDLELFTPETQPIAQKAVDHQGQDGLCLPALRQLFKEDIIRYLTTHPHQKLSQYPGINQQAFQNNPALTTFLQASQPGTKKIDKPLLIIQGDQDTNVPVSITEKLKNELQALGSPILNGCS